MVSPQDKDSLKITSKHKFWFLEHHQHHHHHLKRYIMNCMACVHMGIVY